LRLLVGPDKNPPERAAFIHQDARAYASVLGPGKTIEQPMAEGRHAWVQVAQGNITLNGVTLKEGDGAAISEERELRIEGAGAKGGEFILIDLA
jgi:redox-sensitive bicupin YhaK (pirin superfamily)